MGQPVARFEIMGPSVSRLQKFYATLFEWDIVRHRRGYAFVDGATSRLPGAVGWDQNGPRVTIYVQVPDVQAALDQAVALGGRVVLGPIRIGTVTLAQFADPGGNLVGLVRESSPRRARRGSAPELGIAPNSNEVANDGGGQEDQGGQHP